MCRSNVVARIIDAIGLTAALLIKARGRAGPTANPSRPQPAPATTQTVTLSLGESLALE